MGDWFGLMAVVLPLVFLVVAIIYLPNRRAGQKGDWIKPAVVAATFFLHIFLFGSGVIFIPDRFGGLGEPRFSQVDAAYLAVVVLFVWWVWGSKPA